MNAFGEVMTVAVDREAGGTLAVNGEVDASNAGRLWGAIVDAAAGPGTRLELDLSGVTFMDSSGLRAIADAARAMDESTLVLSNVPRQVLRLLAISDVGVAIQAKR